MFDDTHVREHWAIDERKGGGGKTLRFYFH